MPLNHHVRKIWIWILWFAVMALALFLVVALPWAAIIGDKKGSASLWLGFFILLGIPLLAGGGASVLTHRKTKHDHPHAISHKPVKDNPIRFWVFGALWLCLSLVLAIVFGLRVYDGAHAAITANRSTVGTITDHSSGKGCFDTVSYEVDGKLYKVTSYWHCGGALGDTISVRYDSSHPATATIDSTSDRVVGMIGSVFVTVMGTGGVLLGLWLVWSIVLHPKRRKSGETTPI